jgi:hypothetical protein
MVAPIPRAAFAALHNFDIPQKTVPYARRNQFAGMRVRLSRTKTENNFEKFPLVMLLIFAGHSLATEGAAQVGECEGGFPLDRKFLEFQLCLESFEAYSSG